MSINVTDSSTCGFKQGSQLAKLMARMDLIIWDEAPMTHRNCFEAVDRSLRDILRFSDPQSGEKPFGGKTIILGGDFQQILPVQNHINMTYTPLNQISTEKDSWNVKVRIIRMWDAVNVANGNELINLDMIMGTLLHACIRKNFAQRFRPLFNEGCIYAVKNFIVEEYRAKYRPVHNHVKLLFMSTTSVSKIHGVDHSIPQHGFKLADYETITSRYNDVTYLTDVIGRLESIGVIEEINSKALQIDEDFYNNYTRPFIVIVTSTTVKTFRDEYNLSSTSATRVYINLKIPEVSRVLDKLNNVTITEVKELKKERPPIIPDKELALHNRKTIAEIKQMDWKPEIKEVLITCLCNVNRIDTKFGWYKIQIEVFDTTDSTTFIVFDKEAEQLIGKTAKELANMQDEDLKDNMLPREIETIVSK
ncbi:uncharacterized protein LOC132181889 [Corylus avellana]|uniref:uncharacterized protein LOC132181889 n=1 Tax=Corylus avellana TaxID=13451 RepID=UPI00286CAFB5|nr:uncharacterized protein LOC132181889 [Corylus avellana]